MVSDTDRSASIMTAANNAATRVNTWSEAKKDFAHRASSSDWRTSYDGRNQPVDKGRYSSED